MDSWQPGSWDRAFQASPHGQRSLEGYSPSAQSVMSDSLQRQGLWPTRLLCPWGLSRQEYTLLQRIFLTQGSNPGLPHCRQIFFTIWATIGSHRVRHHCVWLGMPLITRGCSTEAVSRSNGKTWRRHWSPGLESLIFYFNQVVHHFRTWNRDNTRFA